MSGTPFEIRVANATREETAAISAVLRAVVAEEDSRPESSPSRSRWVRRGRLEAQGLSVTERSLRRDWSVE